MAMTSDAYNNNAAFDQCFALISVNEGWDTKIKQHIILHHLDGSGIYFKPLAVFPRRLGRRAFLRLVEESIARR